MQDHPGDAGNDLDHLGAVFIRYVRGFLDQYRHQHHALVQYAVVLDELGEGQRHALGRGGKKHGRAGEPRTAFADSRLDQILFGLAERAARTLDQLYAAAPGQHQERDDAGQHQRKPAALEQLCRVRREENAIDHEEEPVE